ncbi:DNA glycosylase [Gonapodya prolifera JEL478]|uniref:Adenine DNA glycosylase n=1 Tax=Gonapodya prolifera (strain JEL478) TaxID=1344416 RepID=A0A139AA49_GONPJ|nr:DNA glycosylase [Gonapodya prolifera JEL478]|eukprot:KXS13534.1 DNA glycosylase [Gonapodya prolifera JEL478]
MTLERDVLQRLRNAANKVKRSSEDAPATSDHSTKYHEWRSQAEIQSIRDSLLTWYDREFSSGNQRSMPWRIHDTMETSTKSKDQRAYEVWISEVMLQQTQVERVRPYFMKWLQKWPTLLDLANATEEDVRTVWSGLGYYSRATRLLGGAKIVAAIFDGKLPEDTTTLEKQVPGIGRYTAGAVTSIAYGLPCAAVDGNVVRVLARLRAIGGDPKSTVVDKLFWSLASSLISASRPGAFNQALMDLGATICTPRNPGCGRCPVREHCLARTETDNWKSISSDNNSIEDIKTAISSETSNDCTLCPRVFSFESQTPDPSVYPPKQIKTERPVKNFTVIVVERLSEDGFRQVRLHQRKAEGLLAGMWEFGMVELDEGKSTISPKVQRKRKRGGGEVETNSTSAQKGRKKSQASEKLDEDIAIVAVKDVLGLSTISRSHLGAVARSASSALTIESRKHVGTVTHTFSHVVWQMEVEHWKVSGENGDGEHTNDAKWVNIDEIHYTAMGNGMKKAWNLVDAVSEKGNVLSKRKRAGKGANLDNPTGSDE